MTRLRPASAAHSNVRRTSDMCLDLVTLDVRMNARHSTRSYDQHATGPWYPQWYATILAKSPWGTLQKHAQNWIFAKNALRKSVALFISHCCGHCPPPSLAKQC